MANKIKDLSGQRFGKLLVLSIDGKNNQGNYKFKCQCDCGEIIIVSGGNLQRSRFNSCGCYKWNLILSNRECKICSKCKTNKKIEEFPLNKSRKDGRHQYCTQCHRKYFKNKRLTDISFRISANLRTKIYQSVKDNKKFKFHDITGCDIKTLMSYIESKFLRGMTWKNYGKTGWHIDHIKPCSLFDMTITEEQKKCFHYTNLQPLWWQDNLKKHNKYVK